MLAEFWRLLKAAFDGWWADRAMSLGASIAFFTVFSLAPMLLAAIAVAGLVFGREAAQGAIVAELGSLVGETGAKAVEAMIASAGTLLAPNRSSALSRDSRKNAGCVTVVA